MSCPVILGAVQESRYRFGFNGQERQTELGPSYTTAEYWMYDGRLGRRWNVDPVIKPWRSSYDAFSNNPLIYIDPLGADDIFYMNNKGKLAMYRTKEGTEIKIQTAEGKFTLSQLPLTTNENRKMAAKIISHYAKQANLNGIVGLLSGNKKSSENPAFAATSQTKENKGKLVTYVNTNGGINSKLNDYNNLMNTLEHEDLHKINNDVAKQEKGIYSFKEHADIYLKQMDTDIFKVTTQPHKNNTVVQYFSFALAAKFNNEISNEDLFNKMTSFNANSSYSITINKEYTELSIYNSKNAKIYTVTKENIPKKP